MMTQLLLFDAAQSPVHFASPNFPDAVAEPATAPLPQLNRSLPLYDPQRGEIHRLGDLAQRVIHRYEIVAQRRAVLLARGPREAARA